MLAVAAAMWFTAPARADDLAQLAGKWSFQKTNSEGQAYTQSIEITKDKFVFKLLRSNAETAIYAEGKVKLEKSGPFNVVKFTDIQGGTSKDELQPIDDDRVSIYVLDDDKWTLAANFDKDRDDQKPSLDVYVKAAK